MKRNYRKLILKWSGNSVTFHEFETCT